MTDDDRWRHHRRTEGRRVIVAEFVTLDGYMVGPDEDVSWVAAGFDPQMQEDIAVDISATFDLFVFGRVTYEIFADYWPTAVPYDEGDALQPAEGKEDARIIRALNDRPQARVLDDDGRARLGRHPGRRRVTSRTRSAG